MVLARFLRDELGSSEGLVWLKAWGVCVTFLSNEKKSMGGGLKSFYWQENISNWTLFIPVFRESDRRRREYYLSIKIKN